MVARVSDVVALVFVVALVYVLVRPQSQAAAMVEAVTGTLAAMIRTVVSGGN